MKKVILSGALVSLFLLGCSSASKTTKTADVSKYLNTISADELKTHLYIVASDENEGRDTGTEGQKKQDAI